MPSSRTATMPADILLDSGIVRVAATILTPVWSKIGATSGGFGFNPNIEMRDLEYDGKRHRKRGDSRIVGWDSEMTGTLLQANSENMKRYLVGATSVIADVAGVDTETITPKLASTAFAEGDYLILPRIDYRRGNGGTFSVVFPFGYVVPGSLTAEDKNEGKVQITIKAVAEDDADDDEAPFYFEVTGPDIVVAGP